MSSSAMKSKDEFIQKIREIITVIPGADAGRPVNLDGVLISESVKSGCGGKISITCLFINDDGNVCADMYRTGSAGCVDFICGLTLESLEEKNLKRIISALEENRWSVAEYPVKEKQKKKNIVSSLKIPFFQKGA